MHREVDDDTEHTARVIAAALADYMLSRRFLALGDRLQVKRDWTAILPYADDLVGLGLRQPSAFAHDPPGHKHPAR